MTHAVLRGASICLDLSPRGCASVSTLLLGSNSGVPWQFAVITQLMQVGEAPFDFGQDFVNNNAAEPQVKDSWYVSAPP